MNGKKFVVVFLAVTAVVGILTCVWIKAGYDSRPKIPIEQPK